MAETRQTRRAKRKSQKRNCPPPLKNETCRLCRRALTICLENTVIPGRIQMERFVPVECFRKKGNTFRGIPFSRFYRNSRKFFVPFFHDYQCQAISAKTAMPKTEDSSDESLLFQTVRDVTAVLFSRLLLTDFLQHNCSTQGEKDLSFRRRYLCFTFAFMIRAFEFNGARKHLHPRLRIK